MTIHAVEKNLQIENVVIDYRDRPEGSVTKLDTIPDGLRVLGTIVRLYKNNKPFAFFSIIALLILAVTAVFFIPVFIEFLQTGLVPRYPTLIVCGYLVMASLVSFFSGVILSTIKQKNLQDFELALIRSENDFEALKKD